LKAFPGGVGRRKGDSMVDVAEESGPALAQNDIDSLFTAARAGIVMPPVRHDAETFYVETHYERMARRPGGSPARTKPWSAAQLQIDELKMLSSFGSIRQIETTQRRACRPDAVPA